jgi:uncharacterized protein involved in tolerance to divalent cations
MYKNCNDNISLVSEILACVQTVNGSKSIYQLIVCKHQNIQKIRFKTTGDLWDLKSMRLTLCQICPYEQIHVGSPTISSSSLEAAEQAHTPPEKNQSAREDKATKSRAILFHFSSNSIPLLLMRPTAASHLLRLSPPQHRCCRIQIPGEERLRPTAPTAAATMRHDAHGKEDQ